MNQKHTISPEERMMNQKQNPTPEEVLDTLFDQLSEKTILEITRDIEKTQRDIKRGHWDVVSKSEMEAIFNIIPEALELAINRFHGE